MSLPPTKEPCPIGGVHTPFPFEPKAKPGGGLSCRKCHKTWTWVALSPSHIALRPTWEVLGLS